MSLNPYQRYWADALCEMARDLYVLGRIIVSSRIFRDFVTSGNLLTLSTVGHGRGSLSFCLLKSRGERESKEVRVQCTDLNFRPFTGLCCSKCVSSLPPTPIIVVDVCIGRPVRLHLHAYR